jgi:hypothetical protein
MQVEPEAEWILTAVVDVFCKDGENLIGKNWCNMDNETRRMSVWVDENTLRLFDMDDVTYQLRQPMEGEKV